MLVTNYGAAVEVVDGEPLVVVVVVEVVGSEEVEVVVVVVVTGVNITKSSIGVILGVSSGEQTSGYDTPLATAHSGQRLFPSNMDSNSSL